MGSAARENAKYMESLEARTTNLTASFQKLSNDIINKELVGTVLDLANAFVKLADTGMGRVVTETLAFAGVGFGVSQLLTVTKIMPVLSAQFTNFAGIALTTSTGVLSMSQAMEMFGGVSQWILPVLLAVGAAVFGIVEAVKAYKAAHPDLETLGERFKEESASIQETSDNLRDAKAQLDKLNNTPVSDRSQNWIEETERLKNLIAYYEYLLNMQEQEAKNTAQQYRNKAKTTGVKASAFTIDEYGQRQEQVFYNQAANEAINKTYATRAEAVYELANAFGLVTDKTDNAEEALADLTRQLGSLGIQIEDTTVSAEEYNARQSELIRSYLDETNGVQNLTRAQLERQQALLSDNQILYQTFLASSNLTESEKELKNAYEALSVQIASSNGQIQDSNQIIANLANILGVTPKAAYDVAVAMGAIDSAIRPLPGTFVQLEDGTWALASALENVSDSANVAATSITDFAVASYTGNDAAFQLAQKLLATGTAADQTSVAFYELVAQEIIFNNTGLDVSAKIAALQQLALQAGVTADAIASISGGSVVAVGAKTGRTYTSADIQTIADLEGISYNEASKRMGGGDPSKFLTSYADQLLSKIPDKTSTGTGSGGGGGGGGGGAASTAKKTAKDIENTASRTIDNISSRTSDAIKDSANEAKQAARDALSKIEEAVRNFYQQKIDALKEQNDEIDKQIALEEKLKAIEEAKAKQILVYENGEYRYTQDLGAIAAAQSDYDKYVADMEKDEQIKVLEDTRDKILSVLQNISDNLDGYTTQQLASVSNLSSSLTNSIGAISTNISNSLGNFEGVIANILSGIGDGSSDISSALSSLLSLFGGEGGERSHTVSTGLPGTSTFASDYNPILNSRNWRNGQLVTMDYLAETDIPLDVQWWMSMFEAEMAKRVRGGGGLGNRFDPTALDPDSSEHVDVQYWLDKIANAKDLYEARDYYARAYAAGYVLAEYSKGFFDANDYKNFDPSVIEDQIRDVYTRTYINNPDTIEMKRFQQYYTPEMTTHYGASAAAWYLNQNDRLNDMLWSAITPEQVYKAYAYHNTGDIPDTTTRWAQESIELAREQYEEVAKNNREELTKLLQDQIAANSAAWFEATEQERNALHHANEQYRQYLANLESGVAKGGLYLGFGSKEHYGAASVPILSRLTSGGVRLTGGGSGGTGLSALQNNKDVLSALSKNTTSLGQDATSLLGNLSSGMKQGDVYNISVADVSLPSVTDADDFIVGLRNLAHQYSYSRT